MYSEDNFFTVPKSLKQSKESAQKKWYRKWWGRLILAFSFIFLVFFTAITIYVGKLVILLKSGELTPEMLLGMPKQELELNNLATFDDPNFGPKDAKVVIVEFGDFSCSACKQVYPVIKEIIADYGSQVLFVFRDFPAVADHPETLWSTMAASCAYEQGKFWEMNDKIFNTSEEISETILKKYALQVGLNSLEFGNCLASKKYVAEIEEDLMEGYNGGVRSTPTFFINGFKFEGALPLEIFEGIITRELSNQK